MSGKRQQTSSQMLQQQQQTAQQQQQRSATFSKSQNFSQTYTLFMNQGTDGTGAVVGSQAIAYGGGTTPERKTSNNNNYPHNDNSGSTYLKGQRIAIINSKHQQSLSSGQTNPSQQTSLSARPHYNQQQIHHGGSGSSNQINTLIGGYNQIQSKINIPTISPMRISSTKQNSIHQQQQSARLSQQQPSHNQQQTPSQLLSSSTKKSNSISKTASQSTGTTRIDLSKSIQDTYNYIQQQQQQQQQQTLANQAQLQQQPQPANPQIVINQQIQSQDNENLNYARDKIKKLKDENKKLHQLLLETEEKFKSKLDQTRKESQNIMKVFNQILPLLKQSINMQQQNNNVLQNNSQSMDIQEAQNIIRFLELSGNNGGNQNEMIEQIIHRQPTNTPIDLEGGQQFKYLNEKIQQLEDEVESLKECNMKYLKYIQQQMTSSKFYEYEIHKLRKENVELLAFKKSIDLYLWSNISSTEQQLKTLSSPTPDSVKTLKMPTNYGHNSNVEPPPSFLKASLLVTENLTDSNNGDDMIIQSTGDFLEFYKQNMSGAPQIGATGGSTTTGHSPLRTLQSDQIIEENLKTLMPNAMKKSRSSSSPFTMNNNYIKYNI